MSIVVGMFANGGNSGGQNDSLIQTEKRRGSGGVLQIMALGRLAI